MTMQFSHPLSRRLSRYSQDTVSPDIIEISQMASGLLDADRQQSSQPTLIRHSLPVQGLLYRNDAYHSAAMAAAIAGSTQADSYPAPHCHLQVVPQVSTKLDEYDKTHQLHIRRRLQHRISVAMAKGDQALVNLLQRELCQAS